MKCFYHDDLDGRAAAFCVHAWVGIHDVPGTVKLKGGRIIESGYVPMDYNKEFPFDIVDPGEQVWIVDYSLSPADMLKLLDITEDVTWIDHHKSAVDKVNAYGCERCVTKLHGVRGIREADGNDSACVLAWKYIHWWTQRGDGAENLKNNDVIALPVPRMLRLVSDRDTWQRVCGDDTRNFFAAASSQDTQPDSDFWWKCMDHETKDLPLPNTGNKAARIKGEKFWSHLMLAGETINQYRKQYYAEYMQRLSYRSVFEGFGNCTVVNVASVGSDVFGDAIENCDILIMFFYNGEKYSVSLYSAPNGIDVSELAKRYGGGGHEHAAGFQCRALPFTKVGEV